MNRFLNSKFGLFLRWIFFAPICYLLYSFIYFLITIGIGLFLSAEINWYFKFVIAFPIIIAICIIMIHGIYGIAFIIMPNKFFCGLLLGIPYTIFWFWDMFIVISGQADVGDMPYIVYIIIRIVFLGAYWITYRYFNVLFPTAPLNYRW